ncbi:hypothetical protein AOLI_G00128000 [Acnodon oligacanthus]
MFVVAALCSLAPALLLLLLSRALWGLRWSSARDRSCTLPLPRAAPWAGRWWERRCTGLLQGSSFHISRRQKHGNVFKTHLLGKPVIRVTGAEHVRKILLGEHTLVSTQWPQSARIILGPHTLVNSTGELHRKKRKILARVFSREALETYLLRLQDVVKCEVAQWCAEAGSVDAYDATRSLTFRVAMRALLGLRLEEQRIVYLSKIFEQLMSNLFSLPVDAPLSGLRKGKRARDILHAAMEDIIEKKLKKQEQEDEYCDAFDYMLSGAKENSYNLTMQELKETAVELIFAAHSTTASAATSLILQLMRHPDVAERVRAELEAEGLITEARGSCRLRCGEGSGMRSKFEKCVDQEEVCLELKTKPLLDKTTCLEEGHHSRTHVPYLSIEKLNQLGYLDCVVKEVLRYLPPVSGGYRTVLQTFELDGYQIPKGWSVMYSIRDTHETSPAFQSPELFDPDRFSPERDESKASRFSYVPFGGGVRRCIGRELAVLVLKTLCVELLATAEWTLATETYPRMQTVPIVHPVNGLHVKFNYRNHARNRRESTHL